MFVEPGGLLIDTFHGGPGAHVHDPDHPSRRHAIGTLGQDQCIHRVMLHLMHHGRLSFDDLVEELRRP